MDTTPNDNIGNMLITLTAHILGHSSFRNYNWSLKEEMQSHALLKCTKGLKTVKCGECTPQDAKRVFNYFTRACFNAYLTVIGRYYKQENIKKQLIEKYAEQIEAVAPAAGQNIRKNIL